LVVLTPPEDSFVLKLMIFAPFVGSDFDVDVLERGCTERFPLAHGNPSVMA
jgi:hypothetical protein